MESKSIVQSRHGRGTEAYRAPELIEDAVDGRPYSGIVSKYADIWAVGCILYKLATTGRSSAFPSDWAAVAYKQHHASDVPQLASNIPLQLKAWQSGMYFRDQINDVLRGCFEIDPAQRPSAEDLLNTFIALEEWLNS